MSKVWFRTSAKSTALGRFSQVRARLSGFDVADWTINTDGFTDSDTGTWGLAQSGNDLVLSYTVVPEPSAALLGLLGMCALLRRKRNA